MFRELPETVVDRMYGEFRALMSFLERGSEISLINSINDVFRKSLLLCAASYFETSVGECVVQFVEEFSPQAKGIVSSLVRNKALSRQYHTWFAWDQSNANKFFGMFGEEFAIYMKNKVASDSDLQGGIAAFMEIGRERNRLVHQDFGSFPLENTADEIYARYRSALLFVGCLPCCFRYFSKP